MAIVNLISLQVSDLPGISSSEWGHIPKTDLASYEDIWHAAQKVEWDCVKIAKKSGWQPTGE